MNEKRNFDYKRLHPFKWYILENFPFLEDSIDVLTNYQLFCKLGEMYNKEIDAINTLGIQVEGITDWFDDLDLQEEVNNKLDEMAESGELEEIIGAYINANAILGFNTLADLKTATNLIDGSYAKTLGYHLINDDGGATYKIRNITNADVVDEMFIIALNDSNLVAELIIDNKININQLGADNKGEVSSADIIQDALNFIENRWLNGEYNLNTISFNGTYLIDKKVEMSPFAKLTGHGFTTFLTDSEVAFWIHYVNGVIPESFDGSFLQYQYADLLDFPKGCLFKNIDGTTQNTCLEIGEHSDLTTTHNVSRFKLCNFAIENYDIGIKYNTYNVYICNHERLQIELNNIGVKFGDNNTSLVNAGEHMLFDNCLIAHSQYAFLYETNSFDLEVVNSSIDFNEYIVSDPYAKGYHKISFSNSHIEGNNHFLGTIGQHSNINIINNKLFWTLDADNKNEFMTLNDIASGVSTTNITDNVCNLVNNDIVVPKIGTTINPEYVGFSSYMQLFDENNFYQSEIVKPQIRYGNILKDVFDSINDGDITVSTNATINNSQLKVAYNGNFQATGEIVTDNYLYQGHKSLVLKKYGAATTNCSINIETGLLPLKKNQYTANAIIFNSRSGYGIRFHFFDKDGNQLSQTDTYVYNPNMTTNVNTWYMTQYSKKVNAPLNACYFKVTFYLANWTNGNADAENTEYKIGGLIIN